MDMQGGPAGIPVEALLAHRGWVRALARGLAADAAAADDLEQEVWLTALRHPPAHASGIRGWLARVVRSRAADAGRSEGARGERERRSARPEAVSSTDRLAELAEMQALVARAVLDLEEPYRSTVLLRYFEELPLEAVAARSGAPLETVRTRLRRAHGILRERFDRRAWLALVAFPHTRTAIPGGLLVTLKAKAAVAAAVIALLVAGGLAGRKTPSPPEAGTTSPPVRGVASRVPLPTVRPSETSAPPEAYRGIVVDEVGGPVPGAAVYPAGPDEDRVDRARLSFVAATNGDGTFEIRERPAKDGTILFTADGFLPTLRTGGDLEADTRVVLRRGECLAGRVVDCRGAPVPEARVELLGPRGEDLALSKDSLPGPRAVGDFRQAVTDADGVFRFPSAGPFPVRLRARRAGFQHWGPPARVLGAGEGPVIRMDPLVRYGMKVIDAETGLPVGGTWFGWSAGSPGIDMGGLVEGVEPGIPPDGENVATGEWWCTFRVTDPSIGVDDLPPLKGELKAVGYEPARAELPARRPGTEDYAVPAVVSLRQRIPAAGFGTLRLQVDGGLRRPRRYSLGVAERMGGAETGTPSLSDWIPLRIPLDGGGRGEARLPAGAYLVSRGSPVGWNTLLRRQDAPEPGEPVEVRRGETTDIQRTPAFGILRIQVMDEARSPLPSYSVQVQSRASMANVAVLATREDPGFWRDYLEAFPIRGGLVEVPLPTDEVTVVVHREGCRPWVKSIRLEDRELKTIDVVLTRTGD